MSGNEEIIEGIEPKSAVNNGKDYVLLLLSLDDLIKSYGEEIVDHMTEDQMQEVVARMATAITDSVYQMALESAMNDLLDKIKFLKCPECGHTSILKVTTTLTRHMVDVDNSGEEIAISEDEEYTNPVEKYRCYECSYIGEDISDFIVTAREHMKT